MTDKEREMALLQRHSYFTSLFRGDDGRLTGCGIRNYLSFSRIIHEPISKEDAYLIGDLPIPPRASLYGKFKDYSDYRAPYEAIQKDDRDRAYQEEMRRG